VPPNDEMQKMEKNTDNATINQTEINFMPKWIHKMLQKNIKRTCQEKVNICFKIFIFDFIFSFYC
jgi:hypothetical protein